MHSPPPQQGHEVSSNQSLEPTRVGRLPLVTQLQRQAAQHMRLLWKSMALLLILALAFTVYAYASLYFAGYLFPRVVPRPYIEMMSAAVVGSVAAAVVMSWLLVRLYAGRAWLAALLVAAPLVVVRISDLMHYSSKNEPRIMVMSLFEALVYPAFLLGGVWLVARLPRRRSSAA